MQMPFSKKRAHTYTQPQRNALSYFNFLNDEGRIVVAALLPYNQQEAGADDVEGVGAGGAAGGTQEHN